MGNSYKNQMKRAAKKHRPPPSSEHSAPEASTSQNIDTVGGFSLFLNEEDPTATSYIADLEKYIAARTGPRPPLSNASYPTPGISLLQTLQELRNKRDIGIRPPSSLSSSSQEDLPYLAFYAEWRAFLGPDPDEPMAPAQPFQPNMEAMMFFMLFPYGRGHYVGPEGPLTFEEYVERNLAFADGRFRGSADWLLWALTRTQDRDLAAAINCALVLYHKTKARHLGKGSVQNIGISEDFGARRLVPENAEGV